MTTRRFARLRTVLAVAAVLTVGAPPAARPGDAAPAPELSRIKKHVFTLAGPEFEGRRGAGGRKAAEYVLDQLKALDLEPLFGESYVQPIPGKEGEPEMGRNVGAILRGADPDRRDEWLIVSAHFDHLGMRGPTMYPGADDNASGVAMMLEVARALAGSASRPARSVMFVGFDLEEVGLFGSRYFIEHMPVPLDKVSLFITADMIGRSLGGVSGDRVFVMGAENAPGLRPWVEEAARGLPLTVGRLGSDLLLINRSDYGPFRSRSVPYLFFSTGENPVYHTPRDVPETIDYPKVEAVTRLILGVTRTAANADEVPAWGPARSPDIDEARTIQGVLRTLLEHRDELKVGGAQVLLMRNALRSLDLIVERGDFTAEERVGVINVARIILFSTF